MKNFKLLLATTAILSTGAVMANAENGGIMMNAGVNITRAGKLKKTQDINFGSVVIPTNATELVLYMGRDGEVTAGDESVHVMGDSFTGRLEGAPCSLLSYPDNVEITSKPTSEYNVTGSISDIICVDSGYDGINISSSDARFFALELNITSTGPLASGRYYGGFTITSVYPD